MKFLINRFGFKRVCWAVVGLTVVMTLAFGFSLYKTVKTYQELNSWVSYTLN
ncbi:hypothetical protein [Lacticaseibacillus suihuaensis]